MQTKYMKQLGWELLRKERARMRMLFKTFLFQINLKFIGR